VTNQKTIPIAVQLKYRCHRKVCRIELTKLSALRVQAVIV